MPGELYRELHCESAIPAEGIRATTQGRPCFEIRYSLFGIRYSLGYKGTSSYKGDHTGSPLLVTLVLKTSMLKVKQKENIPGNFGNRFNC